MTSNRPQIRGWAEKPTLAILLGVGYALTIYHPAREVFLGEFNTVDGSIYAARLVDAMLAFLMVLVVGLRWLPAYLQRRRLARFVLQSLGLLALLAAIAYVLDQVILLAFNLPTEPNEVSDKMISHPRRPGLFARVLRSYVVALDKIDTIQRHTILIGTNEIPIGESYRKDFLRAIDIAGN